MDWSRILAIGGHSDDLEISVGGTLAKLLSMGSDVCAVIATNSFSRNYKGDVIYRESIEAQKETSAAMNKLGVSNVIHLQKQAGEFAFDRNSVDSFDEIIENHRPTILLTHYSFDTHQDHFFVSRASIAAARRINNILMYEPFPPSGRSYVQFKPQLYVDITDYFTAKMIAIEEHKSQIAKATYGNSWLHGLEARAEYRGYESGVRYAEAFEVVRLKL